MVVVVYLAEFYEMRNYQYPLILCALNFDFERLDIRAMGETKVRDF